MCITFTVRVFRDLLSVYAVTSLQIKLKRRKKKSENKKPTKMRSKVSIVLSVIKRLNTKL